MRKSEENDKEMDLDEVLKLVMEGESAYKYMGQVKESKASWNKLEEYAKSRGYDNC